MNEIRQPTLNRMQPPSKLISKPVINSSKTIPTKPSKTQTNSTAKQLNSETKLPSLSRSTTYVVDSPSNDTLSNSQIQIDVKSTEKPKSKSSLIKTSTSITKKTPESTNVSNSTNKLTNNPSIKYTLSEPNDNGKASRPSLAQVKQKMREDLHKTKNSSHLETPSSPHSSLPRSVENILKGSHRTGILNLSNLELEEVPFAVWRFNIDKGNLNADESDALSMERNEEDLKWWDHVDLTKLILASNKIRLITKEIKYLNTLINLDLHDNKIEMIDEGIGELISLQSLNISHNQILTLPNNICLLRYVNTLNASNNMLKQLPKNFGYLDDLDDLDLSHNSIENIPKSFAWLIKLRKLNLCANSLTKLIPELFFSQSLVSVDLSENQIEELPKELGDLENLEQLFLRQNRIKKLPILVKCCKLKDWDISFNKLEEINNDCFTHLISLVNFNLRENQLSHIPQTIKLLQNLERLDLSNNSLSNLPFELASIESLKQILLNGNPLRAIRKDIINRGTDAIIKHLRNHYNDPMLNSEEIKENVYKSELIKSTKVFDLSCRKLNEITADMVSYCKHSTALVFNLSKNCLIDLPNNIEILNDQLSELNLGFNSFQNLPKSIFGLKCLTTLDLRNNQLTTLPIEIANLDTLRELILSNNRLNEIPTGVYSLKNLENLFANNNKICSIQANEIVQMKHLATLNLQNNDISQIPPELGKATQLKSLQMEGNPFRLPRPNILAKGTAAILDYLRGRLSEQ